MKTLKILIQNALRVKIILKNSESYLAHLPPLNDNIPAETLSEHLELVFEYLNRNVDENGLDIIIDRLIECIILNGSLGNEEILREYIKQLFADTIAFHDFGKVNENFQTERMKNNLFRSVSTIMKPAYGHSELGAFIYLVYHLEIINAKFNLTEEQKVFLSFIAFLFVNSVNLHHNPKIVEPLKKLKGSIFIKQYEKLIKYLDLYSIRQTNISKRYFENFVDIINSIEIEKHQVFPLYALTRLNFSLLTSSDYLATSEYMNQLKLDNLGLIDETLRKKIVSAAMTTHSYNAKAHQLADSNFEIVNPIERSGDNLNIIRQNMAIEVLRNIRKQSKNRLFYLEAPTGGGKTNLSMLIIAELLNANPEINKVFYVFPFTTLITQTHKAILKTLDLTENEVSLLHSKAGFQTKKNIKSEELEDGTYGNEKLNYLNNLFVHYPICLLTHIRFFDIIKTNEKETNYLFHRLANSIVIIDELQSYPPQHWDKMLYFIQNFAEIFNMKFVLMSATLPRIDKLNLPLVNRPVFTDLLPNAKQYFTNANFADRVRFCFDYRDIKLEISDLADIVLEKSEEYILRSENKSVFTIVEFIFKKSVTAFEEAIKNRFFDENCIFVLSGTILESRRREIINFLKNEKNKSKKVLLITTQVVEAGVDIDMDLGFKNLSLIDSDEQLAGRVNRNVKKEPCNVYLFQINNAGVIYKKDQRYSVTRDNISAEEHENILKTKNFDKLYDLVLGEIDKKNGFKEMQNFNNTYYPYIQRLDYENIHKGFQIIENQNFSIFVPLSLPILILDEKDNDERIFSEDELFFLKQNNVIPIDGKIDGVSVWDIYFQMIKNREVEFIKKEIGRKTITGIISKFTFSVFSTDKIKRELLTFSNPEKQFDDYLYLEHHHLCYDYVKGLIESKFDSSENFIL
ncbi:CRISPR-associated endonuclease/helicase Cas3 [Pseudarcicella hirudinis]|uniref:CRISPR-associated endonuclease/helicase Cas3 n=1 Tax=Pseudarcicella hirudinis TaxID=1079859 RepID=A0A1I5VKG9_9BACT|nr:CRISPR-associated helicase/endonuclease Cas3 [Pseudarcicella hirudinis]SFQ08044.1 CRISPR-associated endonuclease/helicase Cas3 [Pseudarcicella hirudinis]